jgi:hypothetical protein
VRAIRGTYQQVDANLERWAAIVKIGPRMGPMAVTDVLEAGLAEA